MRMQNADYRKLKLDYWLWYDEIFLRGYSYTLCNFWEKIGRKFTQVENSAVKPPVTYFTYKNQY